MARCIPESLNMIDEATAGEIKTFEVLRKLPDECIVWYEVILGERNYRPDFMVLDPHRGVLIIEVKDWGISSILKADKRQFQIKYGSKHPSWSKNPDFKCQTYIRHAKESLDLRQELVDERGLLAVPVDYLIAFPNLSKEDFQQLQLDGIVNREKVLYKDDFAIPARLLESIQESMPRCEQELDFFQLKAIREQLRNEVTIDIPDLAVTTGPVIDTSEDGLAPDAFAIDIEQEAIAKEFGEGPRLMRGVAGSGKTLIMLMRAKLVASNAEHKGNPQRILIVCWNISLANYLRQAFEHINIPLENSSMVEITHFMGWARSVVNNYKGHRSFPISDTPDFEERVTKQLNSILLKENDKYDAVYIDEAQDFRKEWIGFLFHQALKGSEAKQKNFIVAADDAQKIYRQRGEKFAWADLDIPMQGRAKILRRVYRNSVVIWSFAGFLLGNISSYYDNIPDISFKPKKCHDPEITECKNLQWQIKETVKTIKSMITPDYSARNILILYHSKRVKGFPLIEKLVETLQKENIPCHWISEDMESKSNFRWPENSVKISTVHSAKGMDAPFVIILSAESFELGSGKTGENVEFDNLKLMYVALTRARERVKVLYSGESDMIQELKRSQNEYQKHKKRVLKLEKEM